MSRKVGTNYVRFGRQEMVVTFAKDRGELRTNDLGDFFFREMADGRFTCASPELEQALIKAGVRAGVPIGVTRTMYGRSVIWKCRRIGETVEMPRQHEPTRKPTPPAIHAFPPAKYATPEPPAPVWPEFDEPAPAPVMTEQAPAPSRAVRQTAQSQPTTPPDNLLARCLCEAVDAVQAAQKYATERGYAVVFGAPEVERMGVSIFIERTRNGAVYERKPAGQQLINGKANGQAIH